MVLISIPMIAALAGCGGKTTTPPSPNPITGLPGSPMLAPGEIPAGESRTFRSAAGVRTVLTCPDGGPACVVKENDDGTYTYTGGEPTVATYTPLDLPSGHSLVGTTTILAGDSRTVRDADGMRTVVTCPAGGPACVVTVAESGAEYTGGAPTVATYLDVPRGHELPAGVTTIPAGENRELAAYSRGRSYALVCPAGGAACAVTVTESGVASTGGAPYVDATTNEMVWQANNGPAGTSGGVHAMGLEGRILSGASLRALFIYGNAGFAIRAGTFGQSTVDADPVVTPSVSRTGSAAPALGLTLGTTAFSTLPPAQLGSNPGQLSVDRYSAIPSLGTDWNGVALNKRGIPGGKTVHAVLYSNIESPSSGGTPDANYLLFGAWLALPDNPAASAEYNMGVFADGAAAGRMTQQQVNSLTGWASYRGPATGLYSKASYSGSGGARALTSAEVGSFTATTTVSTNFGTSGTVSGMTGNVTDFRENGESLGNWRVNLLDNNGFTYGASNTIFNIGRTSGTADGRSLSDNGTWSIQYYRDGVRTGAGHAVGTFTASTPAAANDALHIVGAFGLERQ